MDSHAYMDKNREDDDDDEPGRHFWRCLSNIGKCIEKVWLVIFKPTRVNVFFFWSMVVFGTSCMIDVYARPEALKFFCAVNPRTDESGMGCTNCPDKLTLCTKGSQCWRSAMNITLQENTSTVKGSLFEAYSIAVTDVQCTETAELEEIDDAVQMIVEIAEQESAYSDGCKKFHCGVLQNIALESDLISPSGVCDNAFQTKREAEAEICPCQGILQYSDFDAQDLADPDSPTSTSMQAILKICPGVIPKLSALCSFTNNYPKWCPATTTSITSTTTTTTTQSSTTLTSVTTTTATARRLESDDSGSVIAIGEQPDHAEERRLQTDAPTIVASAAADNALDYTTDEWTPCRCYQQCQPGVRTRKVGCASEPCKGARPPSYEGCDCTHCANCDQVPVLLVQTLLYAAQTVVALLCFICYVQVASQQASDFIELSRLQAVMGFFFKKMPGFLRFLVLLQLVLVLFIVFSTFAASPLAKALQSYDYSYNKDCFASRHMQFVAAWVSISWLAQVLFGRLSTTLSRKPDWLFSPTFHNQGALQKYALKFFRCLGP